MTYLTNPRGRGQKTGYYLPISDINRIRLLIIFLFSFLSISFISTQAYTVSNAGENEEMTSSDNFSNELENLYQELESIRILVKKADGLRAYNHKMTSGPTPIFSKIESEHIRKNCLMIKELEQKAKAERKKLEKKYPLLAKSSIKTYDLAYIGKEDLEIALSMPNPTNWGQLAVLMGIGIISIGMIGVCINTMDSND